MDRQEQTVVLGLVWENDETKTRVLNALAPIGEVLQDMDLWYHPNPTTQVMAESADADTISAIASKNPDKLDEYMKLVERKLSYPLYWQSMRIRMPIQDIYNAKIGSLGDSAKDRIDFQVLDILLTVYGRIPGFPVSKLFSKIKQIAEIRANPDAYMSQAWSDTVEKLILKLDKTALLRLAKQRMREIANSYHGEISKQWDAMEEEDGFLDLLPKTLVILVPDVRTEEEASYILGLNGGTIVHVKQSEDRLDFKKKTIKKMVTVDGSQEPADIRNALQAIALQMRNNA